MLLTSPAPFRRHPVRQIQYQNDVIKHFKAFLLICATPRGPRKAPRYARGRRDEFIVSIFTEES